MPQDSLSISPIHANSRAVMVALFEQYTDQDWTATLTYATVRGRGPEKVHVLTLDKEEHGPVTLPLGSYLVPIGNRLLVMSQAEVDAAAGGSSS